MVFTGTYEHAIDAKNRIAIPAEIRSLRSRMESVADDEPVGWFVTLGEQQSLCLYTEQSFGQRAAELDNSELDAEELLTYERLFFSLARRVEMDKSGRVRLPDQLMQMVELDSEVVLIGVKDHLEIRDRTQWQDHLKEVLGDQAGAMMNPRRAMKASHRKDSTD
ncbi:MAG: hypothetical protein R3336_05285 [Phycisphaeraceae bacterium]|nr:hypothetical protein [Phycisphaeraceae bacterium]